MNAHWKAALRKQFAWPVAGVVLGIIAGTNSFYTPHVTLETGVAAWFIAMTLVLVLSLHPTTLRVGVLVAGLFFAVPCFLRESSLARFILMCCMALPFAIAALQLFSAPTAGFQQRLAYVFTWLGTREVRRRTRSFDVASLLQLIAATVVFAAGMAVVKAVTPSGTGWLVRWLAGGIMIMAFAEIATACHYFLTALLGLNSPALMESPWRSTSIAEFWGRRWNPAASAWLFRRFFFAPLARRGPGLALFAAFFASAVAHMLLPFMATGRWGISVMCGAFFLAQLPLIFAERQMKVRRWRPAAQRIWTLSALAVTSPLFVEPALQLVEPSWGTPDDVLVPTLAALVFMIALNLFFSLGSLVARPESVPAPRDFH